MFGAILGDIIGSPYEFDRGNKTKDFPLFSIHSNFTDDTVMTIVVADAFMESIYDKNKQKLHKKIDKAMEKIIKDKLISKMKLYGKLYPCAGYGARFMQWLTNDNKEPYNSFGNGSAMRVSSVAWLFDDIGSVLNAARISAEVTHNHQEGIKGAQATAAAIFLARTYHDKDKIKSFIQDNFEYDLSRTCDQIRPYYHHTESCQKTVPEAITAFLEGENFEDVIRTAVSLGGDCDTLTAIAGSIAEGFYGVPEELKKQCIICIPNDFKTVLAKYSKYIEYIK